jgi:trigger factor
VKVEIEDISSVKRKLSIEVPADLVSREFEKAYRELNRTAKMKGFRPGKVPRSLLERYYGDRVRYEVTSKLIQETYGKSLEEHAITPVAQPQIEEPDIRQGEDFHYTALVEVKPRIDVSGYEGLEILREEMLITGEQVETRLQEIREAFARLEDVEEQRPVQEGDFLLVQHRILLDGEPLSEEPEERMLELVAGRVEEKLMKALVGLDPGQEVQVPHVFPPDDKDPGRANKEGILAVTVRTIRRKVLPELDDAFAKRLGEYGTLEELKNKVREKVEEREKQRVRSATNDAMIEQLLQRNEFEVREALVELQIEEMIRNTQRRLAVHGITLEQAGSNPEQMRARYRDSAVRAVRTSLALEAVAQKEAIHVTEDLLRGAYERIAGQTGRDVRQVEEMYRDPAALDMLKGNMLEEKALDFLRERAKMVDKKS